MSPQKEVRLRQLFVCLSLGALALSGGCKGTLAARIEVGRDGSSTVTLAIFADEGAEEASLSVTGQPLLSVLDIEPLTSTGWSLLAPDQLEGRPSWATVALALEKQVPSPAELSPTVGRFEVGGLRPLEGLQLELTDRLHVVTYRLSGRLALPDSSRILPRLPQALSPTADSPALELALVVTLPGRISAHTAQQEGGGLTWKVSPGEAREIFVESEVMKTKRLTYWAGSLVFLVAAGLCYVAARRRSPSTSLST